MKSNIFGMKIVGKNLAFIALGLVCLAALISFTINKLASKSTARYKEANKDYFVHIENIKLDLLNANKRDNLDASISLHAQNSYDQEKIQEKLPIIKDSCISFLRQLRVEDLNQSSTIPKVKEELLKRVNKSISPVEVKEVLITGFKIN